MVTPMCMGRKMAEEIVRRCEEPIKQELIFWATTLDELQRGVIGIKDFVKRADEKGVTNLVDRAHELGRLSKDCQVCPCCSGSGWHQAKKVKGEIIEFGRECETCQGRGEIILSQNSRESPPDSQHPENPD